MNFDAKLPQFAPHNLQPEVIKNICLESMWGLDLVWSAEDRDEFRRRVQIHLNAYLRGAVRYAVRVMGGAYSTKASYQNITLKVADAWICKTMSEARV